MNDKYCDKCGHYLKQNRRTKKIVKRELGVILGLTSKGYDIDNNPYFDLESLQGLEIMILKVKRLKKIKYQCSKTQT